MSLPNSVWAAHPLPESFQNFLWMLATQIGRTWWPSKWGCLIVAARLLLFYRWYLMVAIRSRLLDRYYFDRLFEMLERLRLAEVPWLVCLSRFGTCPLLFNLPNWSPAFKAFQICIHFRIRFCIRFSIHLNIHLDIRLFWIILNRCPIELQTSSATSKKLLLRRRSMG